MNVRLGPTIVVLLAVLVVACSGPSGPRPAPPAPEAPSGPPPKILRVAIQQEPTTFTLVIARTSPATGGQYQPSEMVHNWLTYLDANNATVPALAAELPSLENGTWTVNPDGTMEQTWRLRRNVLWHDGTPFTAADVRFG